MKAGAWVLVAGLAVGAASRAGAQSPDAHVMTQDHALPDGETEEPTRLQPRALPDYDGRADATTTLGQKLLWIPRLVFAPLWILTEFVIRRPLGLLARLAEEGTSDPLRFFVFGERAQVAIAPTLLIDFGERPSAGLYLRWNEAGHERHRMRFRFATWGKDWLKGRAISRWVGPNEDWRFELRLEAHRRPDQRYFGIGSQNSNTRSRYQERVLGAEIGFEAEPWRASRVRTWAGIRERRFSDDIFAGETIENRVAQGAYDLPPGYLSGYFIYAHGMVLEVNTRGRRPNSTSGVMLHAHVEQAFDLVDPLARRWLRYGGSAAGFLDLNGSGQVLAVHASVRLVHAFAGEVPFTELPDLGGSGPLRGFRTGRLRGESVASVVAQYSWPIWSYLDALIHVGVGDVYDGRFENFALDRMRMSFGIGFGAIHSLDHRFDFTLAWGTEPIGAGMKVTSTRVTVGATLEF